MCIVAVAHLVSSRYPLIVAANRDERHTRSSAPADWWNGPGSLLAGRDLEAGGSWLGVDAAGRFAAVTNIFEGGAAGAPRSRGELVTGFLTGTASPSDYATAVAAAGGDYGPFNLIVVSGVDAHFVSNRNAPAVLVPGVHVFSNNRPGFAWSKVDALAAAIETAVARDDPVDYLLETLSGPPARGTLERAADSLFVVGDVFGTRCSTVLTVDRAGEAAFVEQRFDSGGAAAGRSAWRFGISASELQSSDAG
jgi:uncharacterized protein with NRDE domain